MIEKLYNSVPTILIASLTSVASLGITTSDVCLSQQNYIPDVAPIYSFQDEGGYDTETFKLSIPEDNENYSSNYDRLASFFDGELRDLTEEEKEEYNEILDSIYEATEINLFDIC